MAEKEYIRLVRARRRTTVGVAVSAGFSSLWLGKDHVLCIDSTGYTEEYKRFYFRDIQAFIIRRTYRRLISSLLIAAPALFFSLIALVTTDEEGLAWAMGIIGGVLWLMLIYNLALGPTTQCFLRTAVQTEELPPLNRLRRARKVLARLRPLIAEAQEGLVDPGEIPQRLQALQAAPPAGNVTPSGLVPPVINA